MQLTKNFSLAEMTVTKTKFNNTPSEPIVENLRTLCIKVLQPAREGLNIPFTINSGYRSPEVNKAIGGVATSEHMKGYAADVTLGSKEKNKMLFEWIKKNCKYTQLINEYDFSWVHVSYNPSNLKNQIVVIK